MRCCFAPGVATASLCIGIGIGLPSNLWWCRRRLATMAAAATPSGAGQHAVVCGAGVIGACTAYFLGQKGVKVTVVDKCGVATAASGKAGGFLALDWCDGSPVGKLARASFLLHQQLAEELGGEKYGYRRVDTLSVIVEEPGVAAARAKPGSLPSWIDGPAKGGRPIGTQKTTAQVHPRLFTQAIMAHAESEYGAEFVKGNVEEIKVDPKTSKVLGVVVDGNLVEAETVVIALGPWSGRLKLVSELTSISGLKAHSIVLQPRVGDSVTAYALFLNYTTKEGRNMDPEIYPRPTGEVYVCGMSEEVELPPDADQVQPRAEAISMLKRVAGTVSSCLAEAEVEAEQACFLPISADGTPLIGKIPQVEGAYLATGHSCWGILNAPATGASLSELIVHGSSQTVDLKPFDPARYVKKQKFALFS